MLLALATYALLALNVPVTCAVGGEITTDTTWTLASSPYTVTSNVTVKNGATLTIEAGVQVRFDDKVYLQVGDPTGAGQLIAIGTSANPITFTSSISASPGAWGYIRFTDNSIDATYDTAGEYVSGSTLQYAVIEYAGGDSHKFGALQIQQSAPFVDHTTIRRNATRGVYVYDGSPKLCHNTIISNSLLGDNNGGGVYVHYGAVTLIHNNITGNLVGDCGGGVYISAPDTVTLTHNTIISNSAQNDAGGIYLYVINDGAVTVSDNIIVGNSTRAHVNGGGGVCTNLSSSAQVTLTHNVIAENCTVESGGGSLLMLAAAASTQR